MIAAASAVEDGGWYLDVDLFAAPGVALATMRQTIRATNQKLRR